MWSMDECPGLRWLGRVLIATDFAQDRIGTIGGRHQDSLSTHGPMPRSGGECPPARRSKHGSWNREMIALVNRTTSLSLIVWLVGMTAIPAQAQRMTTTEITSGACMVVCDDVSFCQAMDYDRKTGTCTIFMNPGDAGFAELQNSCPESPPGKWAISFKNDKWKISCP